MVEKTIEQNGTKSLRDVKSKDDITLLITLLLALGSLFIIFFSGYFNWNFSWLIRYCALIPILFVSYQYGVFPGLFAASFFSLIFIPELIFEARTDWSSFATIQSLGYFIILFSASYIVSNVVFSLKKEQSLSETVKEWGELLSRIKDIDEMIYFILNQVQKLGNAEISVLVLRDPLSAQWEIIHDGKKTKLAQSSIGENFSFYEWVLQQNMEMFLNHLDRKPSIFLGSERSVKTQSVHLKSLLLYPLRLHDGSLLGQLVLVNRRGNGFLLTDFRDIKGLVIGSERSLEQAELYARTDYSLAWRVTQLGAIQRTARELNSILNADEILEKTLDCALEITNAEAGVIYLNEVDTKPVIRSIGTPHRDEITNVVDQIQKTRNAETNSVDTDHPFLNLSRNENTRILIAIQKEHLNLGYLYVESSSPSILKDSTRHVLSILADHAATALENTRLFHEIEAGQLRFSSIINSLSEGVITTNFQGNIVSYNPAVEKQLGITMQQFVGKGICDVFIDSDHIHTNGFSKGTCDLLEPVKSRKTIFDRKIKYKDSGGKNRTISINISPIPITKGHPEGAIFMLRDISQQEEDEQLQKELIAAISHELRAPLANINTITETMMSYSNEPVFTPLMGYITKLMTQTKRLATFSDRILDVYQMETGKISIQLRPVPIHLVVNKTITHWQSNITHTITTRFYEEKSPWVWADEKAIESIFNNLIENAVKYSPQNTRIEIIVDKVESGYVKCGVKDQGPGIPENLQEKIFQRFYRIDGGDSQKVYGHGLGLYITKHLVEMMSGEIWVKSEFGKGSYFEFSLPIMEETRE